MTAVGAARRAFVLGGGVAGLAAAFGLRDRGFRVALLESRGWLGGRAFSFVDRTTGARLDNGPHVMLGCYREMLALLRRLGTLGDFDHAASLRVAYRHADGRAAALRLGRLPAPLALPAALLRLPLSVGERLRALRGLAAVLRGAPAGWSVADWVRRRGQSGAPDGWLWGPMCRAIMNVEPERAAARLFLKTLREAFTGRARSAAFLVPRRPWGEVVGDAAARALPAAGVDVRLGARVVGLRCEAGRVAGLRLGDSGEVAVGARDVVASAVPWNALARLLQREVPFAAIAGSPIVSAHFECARDADAPPDDGPITAFVDGAPFHFLCRTPGAPRRRFALLAGGATALDGMTVAAIERAARAQLARFVAGFDAAAAATVRVAREAAATIAPAPGVAALRPRPGALPDGPRNLFVCGDWTACGLPSTLEGAARSAAMALAAAGDA